MARKLIHTWRTGDHKTMTGHLTRLKAIKVFCRECMGWQANLVRDCSSQTCALYPYRLGPAKFGLKTAVLDENSAIELHGGPR